MKNGSLGTLNNVFHNVQIIAGGVLNLNMCDLQIINFCCEIILLSYNLKSCWDANVLNDRLKITDVRHPPEQ